MILTKNSIFFINVYIFIVMVSLVQENCLCSDMSKKFLYFAYGSNLLAQRIHINSPSAVRKGFGELKGYRLDFNLYSTRWKGASATIVPDKNRSVWGAIWEIDRSTIPQLDDQEGVAQKIYFPFDANIELPNGTVVSCRIYQQTKNPPDLKEGETLPADRQPSAVYLNTMIKGAEETGLPDFYKEFLKSIPNNGYNGEVDVKLDLDK